MSKTIEEILKKEHTVPELKTILKNNNLPTTGNKTTLVKRISENLDVEFESPEVKNQEIVFEKILFEFDKNNDNPTYKLVDLPKYMKTLVESKEKLDIRLIKMKKNIQGSTV